MLMVAGVLMTLSSAVFGQEQYTVAESSRLPAQSYVGDQVELRLRIRTTAELSAPETPPSVSWGRIDAVHIAPAGGDTDVRILVTPFEPGALALPQIDLGEIVLTGVTLHVQAVTDARSSLTNIRDQLLLPGTRAVAVLSLVLVVLSVVGTFAFVRGRGRLEAWYVAWRGRRRPHRRFERDAATLMRRSEQLSCDEFYSDLVGVLRLYLMRRFGLSADCMTTAEIARRLRGLVSRIGADAVSPEPVRRTLGWADQVRFARQTDSVGERRDRLALVTEWVANVEAEHRRRRRTGRNVRAGV